MRAIDADELVENILNWQKMLPDDKSKELLTQVINLRRKPTGLPVG